MPLRDPTLLGVPDPRTLTAEPGPAASPDTPAAPKRRPRSTPPRRKPTATATPTQPVATAAADTQTAVASVAPGDEARVFLQVMAPKAIRRRLEFASFELGERAPRLREHQTIIAALLWQHVDFRDAAKLQALGELLDDFAAHAVSDDHADVKIGANVAHSLKRRLEGATLRLKDTRENASAKTLVNALIWRHVDADDATSFDRLLDTLQAYETAAYPARRRHAPAA